jgi:ribosome recycling factor
MNSDLGLTPNTAGNVIRVPLPDLTEERRKALAKLVRQDAENGRVAVRNIRRDALHDLKELLKEKEISADDERRGHTEIQTLTDRHVAEIDSLSDEKQKEIMDF